MKRQRVRRLARARVRFQAWMMIAATGISLWAGGCRTSERGSDDLDIDGVYHDNFQCTQTITNSTWTTTVDPVNFCGGIFHIATYSNSDEFVIAQNDATNSFDANLWSRFDWANYQNHLYYCQTAFDAASEAAAEATPRSDDTNPSTGGCGGAFAWTQLK